MLKRDYERTPKLEEIEQKKSDLRAQSDTLRKENAQRQLELKNLKVSPSMTSLMQPT